MTKIAIVIGTGSLDFEGSPHLDMTLPVKPAGPSCAVYSLITLGILQCLGLQKQPHFMAILPL